MIAESMSSMSIDKRTDINIEDIIQDVETLLNKDDGHGMEHVLKVRDMAISFAEQEGADKSIVELASILHEVDDYKIFGEESAKSLINANKIL